MLLNTEQLEELCKVAIEAASMAGELIASRSKEKLTVNNKDGADSLASQVFTEVDLACDKLISEHLEPTIKKYDLAILTEETTDNKSRFEKDYFWCVDPLDGTLPFIEQTDGYSVSIGLVDRNGVPHIGVIYNPVDSTLHHAIKGLGAFKNQNIWKIDEPKTDITLVCDRTFINHPNFDAQVKQLESYSANSPRIISHGGATMNAIWVLENHPAVYFKYPKKEDGAGSLWDFAASACIFNEIGAYAKSFNGDELDLNRKDSTFMNHKGVLYMSDRKSINKLKALII
jgi:fructose-1,6-bisphosphatase/inositol monophosphatase family enzyme